MSPTRPTALVLLLEACASPPTETRTVPGPGPFSPAAALYAGGSTPMPASWRRARTAPPPPSAASADLLAPLGAPLDGGVLDTSRGQDLVDALAGEPADDVAEFGAGTFTLAELFGTGDEAGLCEEPHAFFSFEEDGVSWELSLRLFGLLQLTTPLSPMFMSLSDTCGEAVDSQGVDAAVDAGLCSDEEEQGFFVEGGACRACIDIGNDVAACIDAGSCSAEVPQVYAFQGDWLELATAEALACAPDIRMRVFMGARDIGDDGTIPGAWNQADWPLLAFGVRGAAADADVEVSYVGDTDGYDDITDGYGDGVLGRIDYLREAGASDTPHADRVTFNSALSFADGTTTNQMLLSFGGTGQISAPLVTQDGNGDGVIDDADWGSGYGGWGMSPIELRPDGTDPTNIDDTYARDWMGGVVTKMATTRDGVFINNMDYSRCLEWTGPAADGSWTCLENGAGKLGYFLDNHTFWWNSEHTMIDSRSMLTLGSTGLPDDLVPGGFTPHLAGTAALANADWEACAWPHQIVADHIRTEDLPDSWGGVTSLDADTYKFGKDPDQDIRMVLATMQTRGFCPEAQ